MIEAGVLERREIESDSSRLGALFDAHGARLYRLARRLASDRNDAQDLVQETFVRAAGHLSAVPNGAGPEEAWLVRVLVNLARDGWRRGRVRADERRWGIVEQTGGDPERRYLARLEVQRALARLPPRRRAIVVLAELEGMEIGAIGRLLGISAVTVRWHLLRARSELARIISAQETRPNVERPHAPHSERANVRRVEGDRT